MNNTEIVLEQKILVLIDFSESSNKALKYAISLAKSIGGKISLLHVANPGELIKSDNALVASRALDTATNKSDKQLKSIVKMIEAEGVPAEFTNTMGVAIPRIDTCTEKIRPSLIVLGREEHGDTKLNDVMNHLLYQSDWNLLIVGNEFEFNERTKISLECNNDTLKDYSPDLLSLLRKKTKSPLRIFVNKKKRLLSDFVFPNNWRKIANKSHKFCYKNNQNFSVATSLMKHISDEKIELLCIGRKQRNKSIFSRLFNQASITNEVIIKSYIPTLVMATN